MTFYAAAYRHVPVSWIVAILNLFSLTFNVMSWSCERVWSFLNAIWYNLIGFDKYFIFMDNSPVPIPYWYFGGYPGNAGWIYDARNKTFTYCVNEERNKKQYLPVLAIDLIARQHGALEQWDVSSWLEDVTFYTHNEQFPHPLQLLSAWSLESRFWPATNSNSHTRFMIIDAQTADSIRIDLRQDVALYKWYDNCEESEESEEEDEESQESQEEEEESQEESQESEVSQEEESQESQEESQEEVSQKEVSQEEVSQEESQIPEEQLEEQPDLPASSSSSESDESMELIEHNYMEDVD